jgi:hypothetical protein
MLSFEALTNGKRRVAGRTRILPAPSERSEPVSQHSAQA